MFGNERHGGEGGGKGLLRDSLGYELLGKGIEVEEGVVANSNNTNELKTEYR